MMPFEKVMRNPKFLALQQATMQALRDTEDQTHTASTLIGNVYVSVTATRTAAGNRVTGLQFRAIQ